MSSIARISLCCIIAVTVARPATAQHAKPVERPSPEIAHRGETQTGKERLGHKWTNEQRIDNCNVPIDKRGARPRPTACPNHLTN
jgi:hypothetical protein